MNCLSQLRNFLGVVTVPTHDEWIFRVFKTRRWQIWWELNLHFAALRREHFPKRDSHGLSPVEPRLPKFLAGASRSFMIDTLHHSCRKEQTSTEILIDLKHSSYRPLLYMIFLGCDTLCNPVAHGTTVKLGPPSSWTSMLYSRPLSSSFRIPQVYKAKDVSCGYMYGRLLSLLH